MNKNAKGELWLNVKATKSGQKDPESEESEESVPLSAASVAPSRSLSVPSPHTVVGWVTYSGVLAGLAGSLPRMTS